MNLSGYVRHVTVFSWMYTIACCRARVRSRFSVWLVCCYCTRICATLGCIVKLSWPALWSAFQHTLIYWLIHSLNLRTWPDPFIYTSKKSYWIWINLCHCQKLVRLPGCVRLRNDLYCVGWGIGKLYSLTIPIRCMATPLVLRSTFVSETQRNVTSDIRLAQPPG